MSEGSHIEHSPEEARERIALEIIDLLGVIVEQGAEYDPAQLKALRDQVQSCLQALGLTSLDDETLMELVYQAKNRDVKFSVPRDYPSAKEFAARFKAISSAPDVRPEQQLTYDPDLSEVMTHGRGNWHKLQTRGFDSVEEYLHQLGQLMSDRRAYSTVFPSHDDITLRQSWWVENGRHRVLALKALGEQYVASAGMSGWIQARLDREVTRDSEEA